MSEKTVILDHDEVVAFLAQEFDNLCMTELEEVWNFIDRLKSIGGVSRLGHAEIHWEDTYGDGDFYGVGLIVPAEEEETSNAELTAES